MKHYIMKNKLLVVGYLLFALAFSGVSVYISVILRDIVDVAVSLDLHAFWELMIQSAIFFVMFGILYYLSETVYANIVKKIISKVRQDVFSGVMRQDVASFESVNSADYISALTNDMKLLEENYLAPLATAIQQIMALTIAIGFLIYYSWEVTLGMVGLLLLLVITQSIFGLPIKKRQRSQSEALSVFTISLKDIFSGFEVIRSFQIIGQTQEKFDVANEGTVSANFKFKHLMNAVGAISATFGLLLQIGVVFLAAYFIIQGRLSVGTMVGLLVVSGQVVGPVQALGQMMPMIAGSKEIRDRLVAFACIKENAGGTDMAVFEEEIRLVDVTFTYVGSEQSAINDVNIAIGRNKKYAFVGKSGCGKTTLAKILIGQMKPGNGDITMDNVPYHNLSTDSLYKMTSIVHQQVYMFDESIEENISLGQAISKTQLAQAVEESGVSLFLDEGRTLDASVGENGSNLSGGQRQRIAVARALVQHKPLLILDEGTSALDKQTSYDIENRLLRKDDLTLITITHSLEPDMLARYDEVVFMEEGKIMEIGKYADLVAKEGAFFQYMHGVNE